MKPELSILVITRNELPRLSVFFDALMPLGLRHEVVVLDSNSSDGTVAMAKARGARVLQVAWKGFAATKNEGFRRCASKWILSLDADENPDREFLRGLVDIVRAGRPGAFEVNRLNYFLERPMWRSGWHPDWQIRLFSKGAARFNERLVHEGMKAGAGIPVGRVLGLVHHRSYVNLSDYLSRLNRYTSLQAQELEQRHGLPPWKAVLRMVLDPPMTFLKMYVLKLGVLEGRRGFALAVLSASSTFWKYAKWWYRAWEKEKGAPPDLWIPH